MAINEEIVTDRKYRRIKTVDPNLWERISFWTMASDVEMDDGTTLQDKIDTIEDTINAGTANKAQVLNGYTFTSAAGINLVGNMNNWGANTVNLSSSNTATRSAGYYSSITVNCAGRYTNGYNTGYCAGYNAAKVGTATAARVLTGYTFTNNSSVGVNGTMNNWGANTINLSSSNTATRSAGYYSSITVNCAGRYTNAYNAGNAAGYNTGYNAGYNAGTNDATMTVTSLGSNGTNRVTAYSTLNWSASSISGYANLTSSNFALTTVSTRCYIAADYAASGELGTGIGLSISYNSSSGKVSASGAYTAVTGTGISTSIVWVSSAVMECYHT